MGRRKPQSRHKIASDGTLDHEAQSGLDIEARRRAGRSRAWADVWKLFEINAPLHLCTLAILE